MKFLNISMILSLFFSCTPSAAMQSLQRSASHAVANMPDAPPPSYPEALQAPGGLVILEVAELLPQNNRVPQTSAQNRPEENSRSSLLKGDGFCCCCGLLIGAIIGYAYGFKSGESDSSDTNNALSSSTAMNLSNYSDSFNNTNSSIFNATIASNVTLPNNATMPANITASLTNGTHQTPLEARLKQFKTMTRTGQLKQQKYERVNNTNNAFKKMNNTSKGR